MLGPWASASRPEAGGAVGIELLRLAEGADRGVVVEAVVEHHTGQEEACGRVRSKW